MSSSSDIEKLFDHFGGDANAYQEIGRENDARTARTRWPLLVTLDLTQPTIPEISKAVINSHRDMALLTLFGCAFTGATAWIELWRARALGRARRQGAAAG